jgi:hypothetical protein
VAAHLLYLTLTHMWILVARTALADVALPRRVPAWARSSRLDLPSRHLGVDDDPASVRGIRTAQPS